MSSASSVGHRRHRPGRERLHPGGGRADLVRSGVAVLKVRLTGVEIFRTSIEVANAGDNVGLLLHGIRREDVAAGDRLTH